MISRKDQIWFEERIRENKQSMFRVAYAILGNVNDCEDAAASAVLHAWQGLEGLRDREKFRPWLLRILKNECYTMCRRQPQLVALQEDMTADEPKLEALELTEALSSLRPDARLTLTLYYVEGYSIREIAGILEMPAGSIKSRLSRARAQLKDHLLMEEE